MSLLGGGLSDLDFDMAAARTYPSTEDSAERGYSPLNRAAHDPETYKNLGCSDAPGETAGDIADEGRGHRG